MMITAEVLNDSGYDQAILGISLCHKIKVTRARLVAETLAFKDGGHNKFLESMMLWVLIRAPRYWWQEMDTYRHATKQSESTMHTLVGEITSIEQTDAALMQWGVENFEILPSMSTLRGLQAYALTESLYKLKSLVPEGFLQRRVMCFNYKTLRNMILQRRNHRLPHWPAFLTSVLGQIDHPELLLGVDDD